MKGQMEMIAILADNVSQNHCNNTKSRTIDS